MTVSSEQVHVRLSSQRFDDSGDDVRWDMQQTMTDPAATDAPHFVVYGEAGASRRPDRYVRPEMVKVAQERGWDVYAPRGDSAIALNPLLLTPLQDSYTHVLDARRERPGAFTARGVCERSATTAAGNQVTVLTSHLLTGWEADADPGPESRREEFIIQQLEALTGRAVAAGAGGGLAFVAGDTNADAERDQGQDVDWVHARMRSAGFVSCWDDLQEYPSTHGGRRGSTFDQVYRFARDRRVRLVSAKVGPVGNSRQRRADHRVVDAVYDVAASESQRSEEPLMHACPLCGDDHLGVVQDPTPTG